VPEGRGNPRLAVDGSQRRFGVKRWIGLGAHAFTASGAAVGFLALIAAIERDFNEMFAWLGLAVVIDGVDGSFARYARVNETAPEIHGHLLDLIVDFITYVLVPVVALWRSDMLAPPVAIGLGAIVLVASALYFADRRMKTADLWFRGFPAAWNVAAVYLFVFRPAAVVIVIAGLALAALMFTPTRFVHPLRVARFRALTLAVTCLWLACAAYALGDPRMLHVGVAPAKAGLLLGGVYFLTLGLWHRVG
jgi:phosphatidylcholine synthase